MSQHHRNLGIPEGASKADIKRAYRRLAMELHPDKNPDPKAAELFAELQDSYEALMNPSPSSTAAREARTSQRKQKTPAEKAQEARARHQEYTRREDAKNERYFQSLISGWRWKYVNIGSKLGLIIFVALLWDFVLPKHRQQDEVTQIAREELPGFKFPKARTVFTADYGYSYIANSEYLRLNKNPNLYMEKTWLFHIPVNILHVVNGKVYRYTFDRHTWAYMPLPLIVFLVPTFLVFYRRKTFYFTAAYMATCYMIIPLSIIFLLRDDRWLHLITLGFI